MPTLFDKNDGKSQEYFRLYEKIARHDLARDEDGGKPRAHVSAAVAHRNQSIRQVVDAIFGEFEGHLRCFSDVNPAKTKTTKF